MEKWKTGILEKLKEDRPLVFSTTLKGKKIVKVLVFVLA